MLNPRLIILPVISLAVGFFAFSCGKKETNQGASAGAPAQTSAQPVASGSISVNFTLTDIGGKSVSLADYKGKVVLVDFWATWCGPCRQSIPHLNELYAENKEKGFEILAIAMDENGEKVVPPFVASSRINYPVLLGTPDVEEKFGGLLGYPTTFLIDRDGHIADKTLGYRPKEYFEEKLKPLL